MRKVLLSLIAAVAMGFGFTMTNANAAPVSPSALQPSVIDTTLTEDVQWRRHYHHWRWSGRRFHHWRWSGHRFHHWRWSRGHRHYWRWSRRWW
jgi:hypothetical protein